MTTWYSGHGWDWCGVMLNIPVTVLLWSAVVAAIVMATRSAVRQPSDTPALTSTGRPRPDGVATARTVPSGTDTDTDEFYGRLM